MKAGDWATKLATIRRLVSHDVEACELLEAKLFEWGWRDSDEIRYPRRRRLRTLARLVRVDDTCPRLTPELVAGALGSTSARIEQVHYTVDLEGMGIEDETPDFELISHAGE